VAALDGAATGEDAAGLSFGDTARVAVEPPLLPPLQALNTNSISPQATAPILPQRVDISVFLPSLAVHRLSTPAWLAKSKPMLCTESAHEAYPLDRRREQTCAS
jgi:hypothetical protein